MPKDPQALARFQREAQAASALNHPNICTIYEIGEHEGQAFIAMEFLEGRRSSIASRAGRWRSKRCSTWGSRSPMRWMPPMRKGIVHRDIKPANIFVTTRGQAKVLDFGLAKTHPRSARRRPPSASHRHDESSDQSGQTLGTVAYMSPEQALGKDRMPHRSVLLRRGTVRDGDGHAAVQGRDICGDRSCAARHN